MSRKLLFSILLLAFVNKGQTQVLSDALSNKPYYSSPGDRSGSPLIIDTWNNGTILAENGTRYKGIKVNYDGLINSVVFQLQDAVYRFNEPVNEFTIDAGAGGQTRRFIRSDKVHPQLPAGFVELLATGPISLYKNIGKTLVEVTDYNSVPRKVIEDRVNYFLIRDGKLQRVLLSKKGLQEALPEFVTRLEKFIQENDLSPKKEADWIRIIDYCNQQQ